MVTIVARWYAEHDGGLALLRRHGWWPDPLFPSQDGLSVVSGQEEAELPEEWPEPYEILVRAEECRMRDCVITVCSPTGQPIAPVKANWPVYEGQELVTIYMVWEQNIFSPRDKIVVHLHRLERQGNVVKLVTQELLRSDGFGGWKDTTWAPVIWATLERKQ